MLFLALQRSAQVLVLYPSLANFVMSFTQVAEDVVLESRAMLQSQNLPL